jgi:Rieske Fe-S protein
VKCRQIFFAIALLIAAGCGKDDRFEFPYIPINLRLGIHSDLGNLGPNMTLFWPGYGVQGLVIYRDSDSQFSVYDRACTYEKDHSCAVDEYPDLLGRLECPCCKSTYLIPDFEVFSGPASHPLVKYSSFIDGGFLRIVN